MATRSAEAREASARGGRKGGATMKAWRENGTLLERTPADWLELLGDGGFPTWKSSPHVMWLARRLNQ